MMVIHREEEKMYQPSQEILDRYASVLVNFALNDGRGMQNDEVVQVTTPIAGLPLARAVYRRILRSGGHPMVTILDDDLKLIQLQEGSDRQIGFFPDAYYRGFADTLDHSIRILADLDPLFLSAANPRKIIACSAAMKPYREWLDAKEDAGNYTWTLCLYGTEGVAQQAGMRLEEYWEQIERACFLTESDPIARWRSVYAEMQRIIETLNAMPIVSVHLAAPETDLTVPVGENRLWLGGRGRNIPSFEIFTSPDWRGVEGRISFDLPLFRYGQIVRDIALELRNGRIVTATAKTGEPLLREMIAQHNADKIGEFSLTDRRFSHINRFMAETLFDENFGGDFGNTHLAVGRAYHDACSLNIAGMTPEDFDRLGYNDSPEHADLIATTDRTVTAALADGSRKVIYEGGEFRI
jgi:aminopeptidase